MSKCNFCHIEISSNSNHCPICLKKIENETNNKLFQYPIYLKSDQSIKSFGLKLLLFIFITFFLISAYINFIFFRGFPWSLIIGASLFYTWILIKNTIVGKSHFGTKVLIQLFGISHLLIVIDVSNGNLGWSVNYSIPFLIIISNLLITFKIIQKKIKWRDYSVFLITLVITGFVPLIFYFVNIIKILWPTVLVCLLTFIILLGFFTFSFKRFSREILKIFHF
ncbi:MAG: hypothetical protein JXR64_01170 [Spirochaetales bacterium]|nr:hypothetical protein [Spirochaetales bacterium]